jgi:hypothetical protein
MTMADLSKITVIERKLEILHPATGEKIGIRVGLLSLDDPKLEKLKRMITDEKSFLAQRGKFLKADELETNLFRVLFTTMTGWEWYNPTGKEGDEGYDASAMPDWDGAIPDFNQKNVYAMLKRATWFRDQLEEAQGETKAFFANSEPS